MTSPAQNTVLPVAFRERGLTMMELLVTVVILSLLMAGLSQLVVTNSQNANATGALARIADTGRTALQLLSADIRRAGYLGGNIASDSITDTQDIPTYAIDCIATTTDWARMVNQPIVGINAPDDNSAIPYACIADEWLRGDVLTVRYAPTPTVEVADMITTRPYLRATMIEGKIFLGSEAEIENPENAMDEIDNPETAINDSSVRDYSLVAHAYFVGTAVNPMSGAPRTCRGNEIPALFRTAIGDDGLPETQELLAGVENLQLRYLVDNRYYDANEVPLSGTRWPRVDAVEITVLVRAECPEAGFDINRTFALGDVSYTPGDVDFRRQVFTTTTHLRN